MMRYFLFVLILVFSVTLNASVSVSMNGTTYTIPQTNEKGWGTNVTSWIQATSLYTLQPSGGTFTLTADVDFGSSYGLKAPYLTTKTTVPATAGVLRLAKTDAIDWRNNANSANLGLTIDGSDNLTFNSVIVPTATSANVQDSTFTIYDNGDSTKKIAFEASGITTATTRTFTMPDASLTLVGRSGTLTNHGVLLGAGSSTLGVTAAGSSGQILASGGASADPAWTTPTYPTSSGTSGKVLVSDGTNVVYSTPTFPNASATSGKIMVSDGTNWVASTPTYPNSSATTGKILRSDGTNFAASTSTFPDTASAGTILAAASANTVSASSTPTLGAAGGGTGTLSFSGNTSGTVTIQPQAAAGTYNFNLPTTAGSSGQVLTSAGGGSSAMTWTSPLTNPMTTTGDIIYSSDNSGTPARLAAGTQTKVLTMGASIPAWSAIPNKSYELTNCSITASVAANAITIALKDASGSDPSASSPCVISFRNSTATTGTFSAVSTAAATSVVVSNGSALGCIASSACTLYVYAIDNSGTVELAVIGGIVLDEGSLQSSTAEGGAGAADSAGTLYSTTARASKAVRMLGRITITPGGSFAWSASPTELSNVPFQQPADLPVKAATINCDSGSAITSQTGTWITSVGNISSAACQINFQTGVFQNAPRCWASVISGTCASGVITLSRINGSEPTTSSVTMGFWSDTGAGCTVADFELFCAGY